MSSNEASAACIASCLFGLSTARAQDAQAPLPDRVQYNQLVLDGSYAASGVNTTGDGGGAALRFGRVIPLRYATIVPEGVADVFAFSGTRDARIYGASGGARLRFGRLLEPGVFTHAGVAGVQRGDGYAAPTVDVGVTLDLSYFERLLLGVQGEYKAAISTAGNPSFSWYTAGVSVGVKL
jgi:hypothetical protein